MAETKIKRFHHVSLAVNNAEEVMEAWSSVMGFGPWTCLHMKGEDRKGRPWTGKEYWAKVGDVVIELIEPGQGRIVQSKFLDTVGPGLHRVAFEVEDVDETLAEYLEKGAELILHRPGRWAYFRTGGAAGTVIEISQHQVEIEREVVKQ